MLHQIAQDVSSSLEKHFPHEAVLEIIAEPGRYMVASAFTIGVNIIAKRTVTQRGNNSDEGNCLVTTLTLPLLLLIFFYFSPDKTSKIRDMNAVIYF